MNYNELLQTLANNGIRIGIQIIGAIIVLIIGRKLIQYAVKLADRALTKQQVDPTVLRYISSIISVTLNIVLVIAILGYFGLETTTFAALLASLGLAVGLAWSGLLSNFAAGAFIIVLRPYKVGDFITAGGITGTVREIGLFVTTIDTMDNVFTIVGNGKIFSDVIQNFSTNAYRRIDLKAQLDHSTNVDKAIGLLRAELAKVPNVLTAPTVDVEVLEFNLAGPVLAVRPYCHNDHYWQVYFATNKIIRDAFGAAGFSVPEQHLSVRNATAGLERARAAD